MASAVLLHHSCRHHQLLQCCWFALLLRLAMFFAEVPRVHLIGATASTSVGATPDLFPAVICAQAFGVQDDITITRTSAHADTKT